MPKKKGLGALSEEDPDAARIRKVINKYKVDPENWLARLGQRSAQQLVLKDPTQNNVRSWQYPGLNVLGQTFRQDTDAGTPAERRKRIEGMVEDDPLRALTFRQSGYDLSGKTPLGGKILLSPEATENNNVTLEHEYMHRGIGDFNKDKPYYKQVIGGEYLPYMYPALDEKRAKKYHPDEGGDVMTFKDQHERGPNDTDKASMAEALAAAKEEYYNRYLSGPAGGMPTVYQPHLGDKPPPPPPSFADYFKNFLGMRAEAAKKAAGGPVEVDDGNPAKRRRMI